MALRMSGLWVFEKERFGGGNGLDWWDEIDESEKWQQGIFWALCAAYASISFVAFVCVFCLDLMLICMNLFDVALVGI